VACRVTVSCPIKLHHGGGRRCWLLHGAAVAIASRAERGQIPGFLDEVLALLIQLRHAFLGVGPAVDEADHRLHQTTKEGTALEALTTLNTLEHAYSHKGLRFMVHLSSLG
jgi:hypothetical protein